MSTIGCFSPDPLCREMVISVSGVCFLLLTLLHLLPVCISSQIQVQGTLHLRNYFYIGGQYINTPGTNNGSEIAFGQIYVKHLVPANVTQSLPVLMIHGHGMTGTNFLNTPDGRLGWGRLFYESRLSGWSRYFYNWPYPIGSSESTIDC
ncbi:hypothetical protein J3R30DRAFT_1026285 [Lentinula aciculospora]|uniref:Uncharacterized protein n=1 Tax=Lentinula aciculospora TaxID=153920 RepID=A0A9W9A2V9_9AGAR|nr:hypothetical protein J3R30DRAFT_1026285 [Lentinula aciculospora]